MNYCNMNEIRNKYPDSVIKIGEIKYDSDLLKEIFLTKISKYKKIYNEDVYKQLEENFKIEVVYYPITFIDLLCTSYNYSFLGTDYIEREYEEWEETYDGDGNKISETSLGTFTRTENVDSIKFSDARCNIRKKSHFDKLNTNTSIAHFASENYVQSKHSNLKVPNLIDFDTPSKTAKSLIEKEIYSDNKGKREFKLRNYRTSVQERSIFFVPIYKLTTFDNVNTFLLNAYTGIFFDKNYNEQPQYVKKEIQTIRQNLFNKTTQKIKKHLNLNIVFFVLISLILVSMNTLMIIGTIKNEINVMHQYYAGINELLPKETPILTYIIVGIVTLLGLIVLLWTFNIKKKMFDTAKPILNETTLNDSLINTHFKQAKRICFKRKLIYILLLSLNVCLLFLFFIGNRNYYYMSERERTYTATTFNNIEFRGKHICIELQQISDEINTLNVDKDCKSIRLISENQYYNINLKIPEFLDQITFESMSFSTIKLNLEGNTKIEFINCYFYNNLNLMINENVDSITLSSFGEKEIKINNINFGKRIKDFRFILENAKINGKIDYPYENSNLTIVSNGNENSISYISNVIETYGHLNFEINAPLTIDGLTHSTTQRTAAVICKNITKTGDGLLVIKGANGANGKDGGDGVDGKDGANGTNASTSWFTPSNAGNGEAGSDGENGKDGQTGGLGGAAINITDSSISSIELMNTHLYSGNCGNGGNGGNGGKGGNGGDGGACGTNTFGTHFQAGNGGDAGRGGNGGNGGDAYISLAPCNVTVMYAQEYRGTNGIPGLKGYANNNGDVGEHFSCSKCTNLKNGNPAEQPKDGENGKLLSN